MAKEIIGEMDNKINSKSPVTIIKKEKTDNIIASVKKLVKHVNAKNESAIVNAKSKSSMTMREDGYTSLIANDKTQMKLDSTGKSMDMTQESITMANRRTLEVEDIVINNHKMNPLILNYTDAVSVLGDEDSFVSRYRTSGTVMVKAWDSAEKKYKYIRRPAALMLFSPRINTAKIPDDLGVKDSIKETIEDITASNQNVANSVTKNKDADPKKSPAAAAKKKPKKSDKKDTKAKNDKEKTKDTKPTGNVTKNGTPITRGVKGSGTKKEDNTEKVKDTKTKKATEAADKTAKNKADANAKKATAAKKASSTPKKETAKKATSVSSHGAYKAKN